MIYIRGNRADYDGWRDQYGADGWGFEDVLPYFVKAEGNTRLGAPLHGQSGPLHVEDRVYTHELSHAFVDSAISAGLKPTDDFNGVSQEGAGQYQVTCRKGRRWSTNEAYLKPARSRSNLTVETGALAARVELFAARVELSGTRATGVTFRQAGREHTVTARREVLLCGGSVNSPQLLMLSGIGPASHLAEVGVESKVDLPGVGANLQDHPVVPMLWHTHGVSDLAQLNNVLNFARWKARGTGPLASNIGGEAGAFFASRDGLPAPDLQIHMAPAGFYDNGLHEPTSAMVTAAPTLVSVASRGTWPRAARCGSARPTRRGTPRSTRRTSTTRPTSMRCWPDSAGRGRSAPRVRWRRTSTARGSSRTLRRTTTSSSTRGRGARRSTTRPRRARWAAVRTPWSTPRCGSAESTGCGSWTPRSCLRSSGATPTRRRS